MPPLFRRHFGALAIAIATTGVILTACGSSNDSSSTASPDGSSPTPFIAEIDLELANKLMEQGDSEEALAIYAAGAERGTDEEQTESLWALARINSQTGDNAAAEEAVETLRDSGLEPGDESAALLLQGKAEFAQGDFEEARDAFEEYVEAGAPAAPYATLYLSQISRQQGDAEQAMAQLTEVLEADLPSAVATESLFNLATLQEEAGRPDEAIATLQRAADTTNSFTDQAEALWLIAETEARTGDSAGEAAAVSSLVTEFPASYRSAEALALPSATALTPQQRGLVLFRNRLNDEAAAIYQPIADQGGDGFAEAQYRLGVLSERFERWDDAIAHYDAAITAGGWYAAQATWDKATVLERLGRIDEAIAAYAGVAVVMPSHEQAGPGVFRAGLMSYQLGRPAEALAYWTTFLEVAPNQEEAARANFWLAETSSALGDSAAAQIYYQAAIDADPLDFYAMRARSILADSTEVPDEAPLLASKSDWAAAEQWITEQYGDEDTVETDALLGGTQFQRANELLIAGLTDRADIEFRALLANSEGDAWATYRLVREIDALERYWVSSPAARSIVGPSAPSALFQLVYPLAHRELVEGEAAANGIDPLLYLALIRQESLYQPDAVSSAEAMGLTQVIPSTADGIAADLNITDFRYTDLLRPRVSVQFGAHYLGGVLEGFGGEVSVALSAYNGGPGNAGRWWEASGADRDLFVETIDYPETRSYVELVMENYALYRYAYGLSTEPVLPD